MSTALVKCSSMVNCSRLQSIEQPSRRNWRVIVPPLTSQYLNITKNSSLAPALAFTDVYALMGTVNQKVGQEVEVIVMIMAVYLTFSLLISLFMNFYNRRIALVER